MNITKIAFNNNRLTFGILLVIVVMGFSFYRIMPRDDMPPFLIRYVTIVSFFPGASPDRVEMLVSDKIEKKIQEIPEVDFITSENRSGISVVTVAIKESEYDLQPIFDNIRRKVNDLKPELPEGVVQLLIKDELGDVFGIIIGLTGEGFTYAELKDIADEIRDGLIKIPDAAKVEIYGDQEERIFIDFDNARLAEIGLTMRQLRGILASINIIISGGDIELGDERIILEPTGNFTTIEDLKKTIISSSGGQMVLLGDITDVYRGYIEPKQSIVKIDGVPGLALGISLKEGGNIIELGEKVSNMVDYYRQVYPIGIEIVNVASQDIVVEDSVNDFIGNLLQAVAVVLIVMLLFLGLRTGIVVASLIPLAILMTFFFMGIFNIGLNQVSLASLIIALGMLVDNAIVVSESILIKINKGINAFDAAISSANELLVPLLVSSLTTAAAFLSFFLAESIMGEIMGQIFVVVTLALLSSWILSLTVITMLCVYFLKTGKKPDNKQKISTFDRFNRYYKKLLVANLRRPFILTISIIIMFVLALMGFNLLPFMFFPDSERALVTVNIDLPTGSSIDATDRVVNQLEKYIQDSLLIDENKEEGIESWSSYIGEGAPKYDLGYNPPESQPNSAHILINTTSGDINGWVINKIDNYIFENFPDVRGRVSRLGSGGKSADAIAIRISGKDPDKLYAIVDNVKKQLAGIDGTKNIKDDWGKRSKKLVVNINQAKAQLAGLTSEDIAVSLQTILSGMQTGEFREGDKNIPIIMRNEQANKDIKIEDLETINIFSQQTGTNVPLTQVADIKVEWQASKIIRRDLYKTITVASELKDGFTATEIMNEMTPWLNNYREEWGVGYKYELGGEAEDSAKAMNAIINKLPFSFFIILLLLIGQFNSYRKTTIVLLTIPLGVIGVVLGLLITNSYFGFMAFLGLISLAGIVINNAIVLLDRIKTEIDENGRTPQDAIISASQQRFRPILLTTFTTSLGLIPLWISGGIMWEPMAISIIFGLLFATVITLLFVPALYKMMFKVKYKGYVDDKEFI